MSPTPTTTTLFLLLVLTITTTSSAAPTVYEVLESYNFPQGILPKGVTGYELNQETGEFKVYLPETCKFTIEGYDLQYKSTITGVISTNRLTRLKGVRVKVLLLWLNIVEVTRKDSQLQFSVGIASANFPVGGFEESPTCGCGFDCVDLATLVAS